MTEQEEREHATNVANAWFSEPMGLYKTTLTDIILRERAAAREEAFEWADAAVETYCRGVNWLAGTAKGIRERIRALKESRHG